MCNTYFVLAKQIQASPLLKKLFKLLIYLILFEIKLNVLVYLVYLGYLFIFFIKFYFMLGYVPHFHQRQQRHFFNETTSLQLSKSSNPQFGKTGSMT